MLDDRRALLTVAKRSITVRSLADFMQLFQRPLPPAPMADMRLSVCPQCSADLTSQELYQQWAVCEVCRQHFTIGARRRIALLVDQGSFRESQRRLIATDPLTFSDSLPYRQRLDEARQRTGLLDAVITGTCAIDGQRTVLAVVDFEFMGGSMGSVVGEKIPSGQRERTLRQ